MRLPCFAPGASAPPEAAQAIFGGGAPLWREPHLCYGKMCFPPQRGATLENSPGVRPPPDIRSDRSFLSPFPAQLTQRETMDGPPLHSLASQASHAAAASRPLDQPQRTTSSLIDSLLGGVGGDVVFSAGTRRVPFTPTRAAWKKLRVSHDSESQLVRHPDLLTSTSSSSTMPLGSLASSSWNWKPHQISQMPHVPRSSQIQS